MKYAMILWIIALVFACFVGYSSVQAGADTCPSCGKLINQDTMIKQVRRMHPLGFDVVDSVLYCPYCGYNTERDALGNIKLHINPSSLWEYRYAQRSASAGCGCTPLIVMTEPLISFSTEDIKKISEDGKASLGSYPKISFSDNVTLYPPDYLRK